MENKNAPRASNWPNMAIILGVFFMAVGHTSVMNGMPEIQFLLIMLGMLLMVLGLILFGISNLRVPVITRWKWLPLATGVMGFVGMGVVLWTEKS